MLLLQPFDYLFLIFSHFTLTFANPDTKCFTAEVFDGYGKTVAFLKAAVAPPVPEQASHCTSFMHKDETPAKLLAAQLKTILSYTSKQL